MTGPDTPLGHRRLSSTERAVLGLWGVLVVVALAWQLRSRPLFEPDEGRNAEVMREMSASGDLLIPRLNGVLFLDKPFVHYAAGALAIAAWGANEAAVRLPGVLSTALLALGIGGLARRWWGTRAGAFAALAGITAPLTLAYTQVVIFDAMLTLWIAAALAAFYVAIEHEPSAVAPRALPAAGWSALAWAAMGLGVLTKGPIALLVPLSVAIPWALWRRRGRRLVARAAPLACFALVLPWVWQVSRADPEFLRYVLVTETWSRMTSNELKRNAPFWYYLPVLLFGALPWSVVPLAGWRRLRAAWRERSAATRYLVAWFAVPFLLFSALHSKRLHYVLPLVPALVLLSIGLWATTPAGERLPGVRTAAAVWGGLGLLLAAVGLGAAPSLVAGVRGASPATVSAAALGLGLAWLAGGALAFASSRSALGALCGLTLPTLALLLLTGPLGEAIGARRSSREAARVVARELAPDVELVAVETFPDSLPFYLGRPLTLVSRDGDPLRSNYVLRRYAGLVSDTGTLRSPRWLAGVAGDCAARRAFLVAPTDVTMLTALGASGRPSRGAGPSLVLLLPCRPQGGAPGE